MKQLYFILLSLVLLSCSENISELANTKCQASLNQEIQTRATVDIHNQSMTNPMLLNDWENVQTISLNTSGNHNVTAPWANGTASSLSESFRKDIKKEDGWVMLFHTFKQKGLDEKQNYMCFYNQFTGYLKFFYYYEGDRDSQGTQWYIKTADGTNSRIFNFTDYLAAGDTSCDINMVVFSNQIGDLAKGLEPGWNGFEFEVPYCTDYKNTEFVIGAYDRKVSTYDFAGDVRLNTSGTITVMGAKNGWQSTVANIAGKGAKSLVDKMLKPNTDSTGKFGKMLVGAISNIPAGSYAQAISAGLNLIFGKSTTVNNYDVKLTTSGQIKFEGTGTTETTSGIPSVTFNSYSFMNSDKKVENSSFVYNLSNEKNHYIGVWNVSHNPYVFYKRITEIRYNHMDGSSLGDGRVHYEIKLSPPENYNIYYININPDLNRYILSTKNKSVHMICNKIGGDVYKPKMIDINDYLHPDYIYKDDFLELYSTNGILEADFVLTQNDMLTKRKFYYDWGNIDCGRMVMAISENLVYQYKGKDIEVAQTRIYPADYHVEVSYVEDVPDYDKGEKKIVNKDNPFYEQKKVLNGIPIKVYE